MALERKQAFIHQVMSGESTDRDIEDIGDVALSFAEIKALATGNPLIMEKAGIDNDVARLQRLRQAHFRDQTALDRRVTAAEAGRARAEERAELAKRAIAARMDTKGGAFAMTLDDTVYRKRPEAGGQLKVALATIEHQGHAAARLSERGTTATRTVVGHLGGFPIIVDGYHDRLDSRFVLRLEGTPVELSLTNTEAGAANGESLVARLESRLRGLEAVQASATDDAERCHAEADAARRRLGQPFDQEQTLMTLIRRQTEIQEQLAGDDPPGSEAPSPSHDSAPMSQGREAARPEQPDMPPAPADVEEPAVPVPANTSPETIASDMVTTSAEPLPQRDDQPERDPTNELAAPPQPEDRDQWGPSAGGAEQEVHEVPNPELPTARALPAVAAIQDLSAGRESLERDEASDRERWSKFLLPTTFREIDPAMNRYETSAGAADALDVWLAAAPWADTDRDAALAMSRADERLRDVAPVPMAEYDHLRARGQEPVEAMRSVAPLVKAVGGERRGQLSVNTSGEVGAEQARPSADARSMTDRLGPWATLNSSDRPAAGADPDPTPQRPDRRLEM